MSGISSAVRTEIGASYVPIRIINENNYRIQVYDFERGPNATDEHLQALTDEVLKSFQKIRRKVNQSKSLDLGPGLCQDQLESLAQLGRRVYRRLFDAEARETLAELLQKTISVPTFLSASLPFPWEVLYEGDNYKDGDPDLFWGFRYTPARILKPRKRVYKHVLVQHPPSNMLFCLHHGLSHAHEQEFPAIERLVKATPQDQFRLLKPTGDMINVINGETLLKYLDQSPHNMIHFACHCQPGDAGADALLVSLIDDEGVEGNPTVIQLETDNFEDIEGSFQPPPPLVFLNACQSVGGPDELRRTFNLPQVFMERGAAAVIATACPVPDLFAAAFARQFYAFFLHGQKVTHEATGETTFRLLTIGEALRETRRYFLEKYNNPLGLAYGLYSPAYYRLAQSLSAGGSAR